MFRTQIQLTDDQARAVKQLAGREGISVAELIRRGVDRILGEALNAERRKRALGVTGRFRSGRHDVAKDHDEYLSEDFR